MKDFNTFIYDHTLHCGKNVFAVIVYRVSVQKKYQKFILKIPLKLMANKGLQHLKKVNMLNSEIMKKKSRLIISGDFDSILVSENNEKQNPEESYTNKYQKHIACCYGYKFVCVDDKFSKPFKTNLGKDFTNNLVNSMIKESRYCSDVMKKHFNKELMMTKENNESFKNSSKCWICDNDYVDNNVKVRDQCLIT